MLNDKHLKKILLVEDDDKDAELIITALREHNLVNNIERAADGEIAWNTLDSHRDKDRPALILLDLKLPKITGVELLKKIREDDGLKDIPVVVLTSSKEERDLVDCYKMHVNAYVVKPLEISQFFTAVKQLGIFWAVLNEPPPQGQ